MYKGSPSLIDMQTAKANAQVQNRVNEVIDGWPEVYKLMPAGSRSKLYIPFYLAFRDLGAKPSVSTEANLVYHVK